MRFFPREKGKTAFVEGFSLKRPFVPFSRGENRISQGVENRGSLISVPLALRELFACISYFLPGVLFAKGSEFCWCPWERGLGSG